MEYHATVMKVTEIIEFETRIMKIMKVLQFHERIMKTIKKHRIPLEDQETHTNH